MLDLISMDAKQMMSRVQPICVLADGGRFAVASLHFTGMNATITGWSFGTKLFSNPSRARVRLDGQQKQVIFGDGNRRREFDAAGSSEVNYPTMLEVVPLTEEEYQLHITAAHQFRRSGGANTMEPKQIKAMQAKYKYTAAQLAKAVETEDAAKVEMLTKQLDQLTAQATEAGVDLNAAPDNLVTMDKAPKTSAKQVNAVRKAGVKAAKAAKPAKAAKQPKADATTYDCLCGCGTECNGMFAPGHDARVKGQMYKVERGEIDFTELPVAIQPLVKMAGRKSTAGKDDSDYRVVQSPVKFPGRDEIKLVGRDGKPRDGKGKSVAA